MTSCRSSTRWPSASRTSSSRRIGIRRGISRSPPAIKGKAPFSTTKLPYGSQVLWPDHCIQGTYGAELHPGLALPRAQLIVRKGYHKHTDSYSAFLEADRKTPTGLDGYLAVARHQTRVLRRPGPRFLRRLDGARRPPVRPGRDRHRGCLPRHRCARRGWNGGDAWPRRGPTCARPASKSFIVQL